VTEPVLPVIDIDVFRRGGTDLDERVSQLDSVCRGIGFFAVVGHEIDDALIDAVFAQARRFFALPIGDRMAISIDQSDNHTGYVPFEQEQLQPDLRPDMKESLDLALEPAARWSPGHAGADKAGAEVVSQWPELAGFQDTMVAYQRSALDAAMLVLRGLALALGLSAGYFERVMRDPWCSLRLLHYPPAPGGLGDDQLGCGAHSDYGLITLLLTDGVAGLEVRNRDGDWLSAAAPPGSLVVNLGDLLARWTNDRYVSTPHRVTNPPDRDRYSVPFFVNPDPDAVVASLPSCVDRSHLSRYEPIRAADYLESRFDDTHAYRRSDLGLGVPD
jgi:isopenicillin N synthase-like dioxygenase